MRGHSGYIAGASFGLISLVFLMDSLHLTEGFSILYVSLSLITFLFSILTGRKIAALMHDAHVLKLRTRGKISIYSALYLPVFLFIVMLIIMSILIIIVLRSAQLVESALFSGINTFIYSNSAMLASYFLFRERYSRHMDVLVSSWGRRADSIFSLKREITVSGKRYMENGMNELEEPISRIASVFSDNRERP